jgi:hypothetical protein
MVCKTFVFFDLNRWLSEKYDGIRAYWDGNAKLYFKTGKEIHAPRSFIRLLPHGLALDGELWFYSLIVVANVVGVEEMPIKNSIEL